MLENVAISKTAVKWVVPVLMEEGRDCSEKVTGRLGAY